jgi:hypothetical protein
MLAAIEFDNQTPLDATKIGKIRTNPVLPAEFGVTEAPGSEVPPQFPFLRCGLGTKPTASITRGFTVSIHNRAPDKAR